MSSLKSVNFDCPFKWFAARASSNFTDSKRWTTHDGNARTGPTFGLAGHRRSPRLCLPKQHFGGRKSDSHGSGDFGRRDGFHSGPRFFLVVRAGSDSRRLAGPAIWFTANSTGTGDRLVCRDDPDVLCQRDCIAVAWTCARRYRAGGPVSLFSLVHIEVESTGRTRSGKRISGGGDVRWGGPLAPRLPDNCWGSSAGAGSLRRSLCQDSFGRSASIDGSEKHLKHTRTSAKKKNDGFEVSLARTTTLILPNRRWTILPLPRLTKRLPHTLRRRIRSQPQMLLQRPFRGVTCFRLRRCG